jgi:hypothetical protein
VRVPAKDLRRPLGLRYENFNNDGIAAGSAWPRNRSSRSSHVPAGARGSNFGAVYTNRPSGSPLNPRSSRSTASRSKGAMKCPHITGEVRLKLHDRVTAGGKIDVPLPTTVGEAPAPDQPLVQIPHPYPRKPCSLAGRTRSEEDNRSVGT